MKPRHLIIACAITFGQASAQPVINEILADNRSSLEDGNGDNSDWIELYNPTNAPIDLSGYHLTDEITEAQKFTFPTGSSIAANSFLIVFASNQDDSNFIDSNGFQHTNFSLNSDGEYLALNAPDGSVIDAISPNFPPQFTDISYGRDATGSFRFFEELTPQATNSLNSFAGLVADTTFSVDRGYFTAPFSLEISSATPGAEIFFTIDGTPPSPSNGFRYQAPFSIGTTITVRAIATLPDYLSTNVDTQSYLFVNSIINQGIPRGFPASTWAGAPADYAMDPQVVNDVAYSDEFEDSFAALPTLSLVFDPDAFFDPSTGIYQNPSLQGSAWERPLSVELIIPDDSEEGFQIDAGVRIQGGSSRNPDTPKHALSLRFRSEYGASKLDYPLYQNTPHGDTAVESFDYLQLRPEYNYGWMHRHWFQAERALYGRDQWASDLYLSMGQNGTHGRWVHLFLNGSYWGVYDLHERPDADHMAEYFGGDDSDYDAINNLTASTGDLVAYNTMMDLAYSTIETSATYLAIQEYVDLDSFIDYILVNYYIGNRDWDFQNWRAARKREPGAPFLFFPWDSEFAISNVAGGAFANPPDFFSTSLATNLVNSNRNRRPTGMHTQLLQNDEYRIRFADRIQKHFFNDGALVPESSENTWIARSEAMTSAIIAESARWGDFRRDVNPSPWVSSQFDLYTRDDHYLPTLDWVFDTYLPQRSDIVVQQFRAQGTFPSIAAPQLSLSSGLVPRGSSLTITSTNPIYVTIDGTDPRLEGGGIRSSAILFPSGAPFTLNQSSELKARSLSSTGEWSALSSATFTVDATSLVISEIMYHPAQDSAAEFIEITNTSPFSVSLAGLTFSDGFAFDFDQHSSLQLLNSGESLLIVRDLATFRAVYGNTHDSIIAGTFQEDTGLSNGGETITLSDANGIDLTSITYNDRQPWPLEADGTGYSLIFTGGDPNIPTNWRPSTTLGGNPGSSDRIPFLAGNLLDYALLGSPSLTPTQFSWTTPLGADDVTFLVQTSPDLTTWTDLTTPVETQSADLTNASRTFIIPAPSNTKQFARIIVQQR